MRNKYPGQCYRCEVLVKAGEGHFERNGKFRTWRVIHANCVLEQRAEKEANDAAVKTYYEVK